MSTYQVNDLHRLTMASISREVTVGLVSGKKACGCYQPPQALGTWYLCSYHIGYQDGIEDMLADIEESLYAEGGFGRG